MMLYQLPGEIQKVKKVKFAPEQAMKPQRVSKNIALLFL
jgi:hypothetical protein